MEMNGESRHSSRIDPFMDGSRPDADSTASHRLVSDPFATVATGPGRRTAA
jgi:hypothetical protein